MLTLKSLFEKNREWAERMKKSDPQFFIKLAEKQCPEYLWIGCSDSRVSAIKIVDMKPGEIFIHRNIGNIVNLSDMNCLSVIQFAVEILKVKHIIVCGHYGCGGIHAAMENKEHGLIDNWLQNIKDIYHHHESKFESLEGEEERTNLLCELNVIEQTANVCRTPVVRNAWKSGQDMAVHGLMYNIKDGLLKDLNVTATK